MSKDRQRRRFEPPTDNPVTQPFWEGTREKKLLLQRCTKTGKQQFYPRAYSIHAFGEPVDWVESQGVGVVHAVTVVEKPMAMLEAGSGPCVVALIELSEGVRILSNVINCPPDEARIGRSVRLSWEELSDGRHLPVFELTSDPIPTA